MHITVPKEDGTKVRQSITSRYTHYTTDVLTQILPKGDLGLPGQWIAPWVEFDYTSADIFCIEKLTITNPDDPSVTYDIIQDWQPNAFDVVAAKPGGNIFSGWESSTGNKITYFVDDCTSDDRLMTQVSKTSHRLVLSETLDTIVFGIVPRSTTNSTTTHQQHC